MGFLLSIHYHQRLLQFPAVLRKNYSKYWGNGYADLQAAILQTL